MMVELKVLMEEHVQEMILMRVDMNSSQPLFIVI